MEFRDNYSFHPQDLLIFIATVIEDDQFIEDINILRENSNWLGLRTYWNDNIKPKLKEILTQLFSDISNYGLNEAWLLNQEYQKNKIYEIFTDVISIFLPESYFWGESPFNYDFDELYQEIGKLENYTAQEMIDMIEIYVNPYPSNNIDCKNLFQDIDTILLTGISKDKLENILVNYIRTGKDISNSFDYSEYSLKISNK